MRKFLSLLWHSESGYWTPGGVAIVGLVVTYAIGQRSGWLSSECLLSLAVFSLLSVLDFYSAGWFRRSHRAGGAQLAVESGRAVDAGG